MMIPPRTKTSTRWAAVAVSAGAMLAVPDAHAATVPGEIVAIEDSTPAGVASPVTNVRQPFVNAAGQVAFVGTLEGGNTFLFVDDQVTWLATDAVPDLANVEPHVATFDGGAFLVSANSSGTGVIWGDSGALIMDGDPAPGFPLFPTAAFTNLQRPTPAGDGDVVWRATVDITNDGGSDVVGLFRRSISGAGEIEALYLSGGMINGVAIGGSSSAIDPDFAVSDDGAHILAQITASGDTQTDRLLVLDDVIVGREGDPVPSFPKENWSAFGLSSVNNAGNYIVSGDSNAATNADDFVAHNGDIVFHEGDVIDGVPVAFAVRFVAINDNENAAFGWASNAGGVMEHVFFACNASALGTDAQLLLSTNDEIDLDGDMIGDFTVQDLVLATNEPGRTLGDADAVFLEVDLDPGDLNAIIRVPLGCCGNGDVDGGESCDDSNDDDTDDCLSTCQSASCGDGFVQAGVEACDDGNNDDGDGCDAACVVEEATTGATNATGTDTSGTDTGEPPTGSSSGPGITTSSTGGDGSTGSGETGSETDTTTTTTGASTGTPDGETTGSAATGGADESSGTDTDGGASVDEGCGCTAGNNERPPLAGAMLLAIVGLLRRRRP